MQRIGKKAVLKMHLTPNGCVAIRFKMLTYSVYAPLLNRIDALPLSVIYIFKTAFGYFSKKDGLMYFWYNNI
jgi:hypothetical protein